MLGSISYEPLDKRLEGAGWNYSSQYGEDGLIHTVFDWIGVTNRWCFEVGAADGQFYSNTLQWRYNYGWSAVLMEQGDSQFATLSENHARENVHCVHECVTDLDDVLSRFSVPHNLDLGVIDIDGQDYWLWHDMAVYRPRVMLVEFHWSRGTDYIPERGNGSDQAGSDALMSLGASKGYTAVARTHVNLLFVRDDLWLS